MPTTQAARKIVVIGPESTGKSSLSADLSGALGVPWVPEFARAYCTALHRPYTPNDLLRIAAGQLAAEDAAASAHPLIICDTDLYVVKVWSESAFGECDLRTLRQIASRRYDGYILTGIDLPWEPDPLREHGSPAERAYFYAQYLDIVVHSGVPWTAVTGSPDQRLTAALDFVHSLPPA